MKKVYVAHPYGGLKENKSKVEKIIKRLVKQNPHICYISPIHTTGYLYSAVSYEQGMRYCIALLKSCDELLLCGDWKSSRGCKIEKTVAEFNNIKIKYESEDK